MPPKNEDKFSDKLPDRPLECTECRKPIAVHYTEIVGDVTIHTAMCADCPELQKRLHGIPQQQGASAEVGTGLACGNCGTTLDAIRVGTPVGCSDCYQVFEDVLIAELVSSHKIPPRLTASRRSTPIHIGRAPGEVQEINPSLRILALNEALNETLKREDYEQAAWLRDQIKALENQEKKDGGQ